MDNKYTYDNIIELLPAYVLGSLDADEMMAVDEFIQHDEALLDRVAVLEETIAHLAYAAPSVAAPEDSLSRLINKIDADVAPAVKVAPAPKSIVFAEPSWLERLMGHMNGWTWATAGFAALCLVLSMYAFQLRNENGRLEQNVQFLQKELNDESILVADLHQADQIISLPGTEEAPEASGIFYTHESTGVFIINGLEPLPAEQTYQLWLVPSGSAVADAVPVGLLPVEDIFDSTSQTIAIPGDLLDFYVVGISIEPAGGSEHLSGPVVMHGTTG